MSEKGIDLQNQSELRDYPELNAAIDNLCNRVHELRKDLDSLMVLHNLILAYSDGKLNEDEVKRLHNKFSDVEKERISKFISLLKEVTSTTEDNQLVGISRMVEALEEGRWEE